MDFDAVLDAGAVLVAEPVVVEDAGRLPPVAFEPPAVPV